MTDTIKVVNRGTDPQTGGDAITIHVQYGEKSAMIFLKPGKLSSIDDLPEELGELANVLKETTISNNV